MLRGLMVLNAAKWLISIRLVLTFALVCSSLSYSMPTAMASSESFGSAFTLEHSHSVGSEHDAAHPESSDLKVDKEGCGPDGPAHSRHSMADSECCSVICFDLTMLSSEKYREARLSRTLSMEIPQSIFTVEPNQFLRPPRG